MTKLTVTSTPGIPDLLAIRDGRSVFIEVKRPGQKPSQLQQHRMEELRNHGVTAIVATSKNEVKNQL